MHGPKKIFSLFVIYLYPSLNEMNFTVLYYLSMEFYSIQIKIDTIFQFSNLLPDYVITGQDFRLKGPGGFLCAGFYGNQWEYRSEMSSCVC